MSYGTPLREHLIALRNMYWRVRVEHWEKPEGKKGVLTGIMMSMYCLDPTLDRDRLDEFIRAGAPKTVTLPDGPFRPADRS